MACPSQLDRSQHRRGGYIPLLRAPLKKLLTIFALDRSTCATYSSPVPLLRRQTLPVSQRGGREVQLQGNAAELLPFHMPVAKTRVGAGRPGILLDVGRMPPGALGRAVVDD